MLQRSSVRAMFEKELMKEKFKRQIKGLLCSLDGRINMSILLRMISIFNIVFKFQWQVLNKTRKKSFYEP
jgi:hypothetical protein